MNHKLLSCVATFMLASLALQARNLKFVYIAHSVDTPIEDLVRNIEGYYTELEDEADSPELERQTIVYLSSGSSPVIANMKSGQRDDDNYERIISELYERHYHDVDAETDINRVIDLFDDNDFLTPGGDMAVSDLEFEFYVNTSFWSRHQNERFIASLFYALGLDKFYKSKSGVSYKIFFPSIKDLRQCKDEGIKPFGEKNLNNINNLLTAGEYVGTY